MGASSNNSATSKATGEHDQKAAKGNQSIYSIVAVVAVILFGTLIGFLAQRTFSSSFIGSGTRLIDRCKANPRHNPEACAAILEARAPAKPKAPRTRVSNKTSAFQLSED